jgi:hypothetical protein
VGAVAIFEVYRNLEITVDKICAILEFFAA